jgi:hypothetical protein
MAYPVKTAAVNNAAYDVSANQWNGAVAGIKNQPYDYRVFIENPGGTPYHFGKSGISGQTIYGGTTNEGSVDGTSASAVIQACLNDTRGSVLLGPGVFNLTTMLSISRNGTRLLGAGRREDWDTTSGTWLNASADLDALVYLNGAYNWHIADLNFHGQDRTTTGLSFNNSWGGVGERLFMRSFTTDQYALKLAGDSYCNKFDTFLTYDCEAATGVLCQSSANTFINPHPKSCLIGMHMASGFGENTVLGGDFDNNVHTGLYEAGNHNGYYGVRFENTGATYEFNVAATSVHARFYGGTMAYDAWQDLGTGTRIDHMWNAGTSTFINKTPTRNYGEGTGTGGQQTIAHGIIGTPNRVKFGDLYGPDTSAVYQSAAATGTNIYLTAIADKTYWWEVEASN